MVQIETFYTLVFIYYCMVRQTVLYVSTWRPLGATHVNLLYLLIQSAFAACKAPPSVWSIDIHTIKSLLYAYLTQPRSNLVSVVRSGLQVKIRYSQDDCRPHMKIVQR
jgi:hypothetical protein